MEACVEALAVSMRARWPDSELYVFGHLHFSRTPEEIELMRVLKRALDSRTILNPGRVVVV
jgi:FAD/FMN-containing dehydrogenase